MKKKSNKVILTMLILVLLAGLASCSTVKNADSSTADSNKTIIATLAGGSPNGSWFMVSTGIGECVNRSYPGSVVTIVTGSGLGNVSRINANDVDAGLAHNVNLSAAHKGEEPFEKKMSNLSAIANIYPSYLQIVVRKDLGVLTLDEIIQNKMKVRLSIDQPGSNASQTFYRVLDAYGITSEEFESWGGQLLQKSMEESGSMLSDGLIDGLVLGTLYPASAIQEAAVNKELVMLKINPDVIKTLVESYGFQAAVLPADAYAFTTESVATVSVNTVLAIPMDESEEFAYQLTRSLVENLDYLRQIHVILSNLTVESMARDTGAPLHPGAIKYYKEIGIL